jgi:hypothetical protein
MTAPSNKAVAIGSVLGLLAGGLATGAAAIHAGYHKHNVYAECVELVTDYEYAPELCDGPKDEMKRIVSDFKYCLSGWLPVAKGDQTAVVAILNSDGTITNYTGNGNCFDGVVAMVMAHQGLTPEGKPLG